MVRNFIPCVEATSGVCVCVREGGVAHFFLSDIIALRMGPETVKVREWHSDSFCISWLAPPGMDPPCYQQAALSMIRTPVFMMSLS